MDTCVQTRVMRAVAGTYGTFWLLRGLRASTGEKAGPIREGVEDRGLTRGNIREQRGRGNVQEATINCETCRVVDNWLGVIKSWQVHGQTFTYAVTARDTPP